jgi:hypothetical protein
MKGQSLGVISAGSFSGNPIANVWRALAEFDTVRLTVGKEAHRLPVYKFYFFEVQDYSLWAAFDLCFQLLQVFRLQPTAQP